MFERPHHRDVALVLQALDPQALSQRHCWFGGGTAMALRHGEYRESVDIDLVLSDLDGYRELRQLLGNAHGLQSIVREGMKVELAREIRKDQYGIRTQVRSGMSTIKFEIALEARIELETPGEDDRICGVQTLAPLDMAAEKLLANADRWADDSVYSRDLIDLAMMQADRRLLEAACAKAEAAYGDSIRMAAAMALFRPLPHDLCQMDAAVRTAFELREPATDAALDEMLLAHRDMIYREHLQLPLAL